VVEFRYVVAWGDQLEEARDRAYLPSRAGPLLQENSVEQIWFIRLGGG